MSQFVLADNVKETASYSGSGTVSLLGPYNSSVRSFVNGIGNGRRTAYKVDDGNGSWENRFGTIASGTPDQITNDGFISSSTGSVVNFAAGTKTITCVPMPELVLTAAVSATLSETTIPSATTTDLGTVNTLRAVITGATQITSFGTQPNTLRFVRFAGALLLTHNAASLILLGGVSRTTTAGAVGLYISDASGNWREVGYSNQDVSTVANPTFASVGAGITGFTSTGGGQSGFLTPSAVGATSGTFTAQVGGINGCFITSSVTSWQPNSERHLKDRFEPFVDPYAILRGLHPSLGNYKTDPEGAPLRSFLFVDDAEEVAPYLVTDLPAADLPAVTDHETGEVLVAAYHREASKILDYQGHIPILVAAANVQDQINADLLAEIAALKARLEALENR